MKPFCSLPIWAFSLLAFSVPAPGAEDMPVHAPSFTARFAGGSLVSLSDSRGRTLVRRPARPVGMRIHRVDSLHSAAPGEQRSEGLTAITERCDRFADLPGAAGTCTYRVEAASGDLVVTQKAATPGAANGVWGVSWSIADIPLEYAIVVPGRSGLRLTSATPGTRHEFDYPITWEAQLVIVEGAKSGYFVWANDVQGRFKRLTVERSGSGWRLGLVTINAAPFDQLTACESVEWRLNTYEGDWRVPARRYRDWADANLRPAPLASQQPGWVQDIRGCVIMGLDRAILDSLPVRFDPRQTLLYLPDWRTAGYDRNYPDYDHPRTELAPFIKRAHELGFRVMLHVNYFGVDPLNPLFRNFEPHQVRDPWEAHDKLWWTWDRADPPIRFAYINPAYKPWRDLFTACMVRLCQSTRTDALHLDQTLCIFNDHGGLIDGRSMVAGSIAIHRQLREALPRVALSGEGLNEVTYRDEAFAQRHVWGLNHDAGTWDPRWLAAAHPISSYLFRRNTIIYGYLGYAAPEASQLYAAWNRAYQNWGVIPTFVPSLEALREPAGFARQLCDEVAFWQRERLTIDLDGPWPGDVAFPYRTADGKSAVRMRDGRFLRGDRLVARTITGASTVAGDGTVPGWLAYDERRLFGLDPDLSYPYFPEPRDQTKFHVSALPADLVAETIAGREQFAMLRTRDAAATVADLTTGIEQATCGSRPFKGPVQEARGPLRAADGAQFETLGDALAAHPPYKGDRVGVAFAQYTIDLPRAQILRLTTAVALDPGAVGREKSDGVVFGMTASSGAERLHAEAHQATAEKRPLELDLTPLAGRRATIELTVDPGPARQPSFDWARWYRPRVERTAAGEGSITFTGGPRWSLALDRNGSRPIRRDGTQQIVTAAVPGALFLLRAGAPRATLPLALDRQPFHFLVLSESGEPLEHALFAEAHPAPGVVGGVTRPGLFVHPPNHGRSIVLFPVTLSGPAVFRSWVGIRDGSTSSGVLFLAEVNGVEVARVRLKPGRWERLEVNLDAPRSDAQAPWPLLLSLITDSDGGFDCDWAEWGEPRIEPRSAPQSNADRDLMFHRVKANRILFLGNSITLHGPAPAIGWLGNWGMAASAADKDYVHLVLKAMAETAGKEPESVVANIASFERQPDTYAIDANLKKELTFRADIVVVAIGENVPVLASEPSKRTFKANMTRLLERLKANSSPIIIVRSCFWQDQAKDSILKQACSEVGGVFVDCSALGKDAANAARSERKFSHEGVAGHPGDRGMRALADLILDALRRR